MLNKNQTQKLYAEVVFLDYIGKYTPDTEYDYPNYLKEELDIADTYLFVRKLVRAGYAKLQEKRYVLTQAGADKLAEHADLIQFFELCDLYVTVQEYMQRKEEAPEKSFEALMIELMLEKAAAFREKKDYPAEKRLHLDIAALYERMGLAEQALQHYMTVLYMDVNGVAYLDLLQRYHEGKCKKEKVKAGFDFIYIRPDVQSGIKRVKAAYRSALCDAVYAGNDIGIALCDKAHFADLLSDLMQDTFSETAWQKHFAAAFAELVESL